MKTALQWPTARHELEHHLNRLEHDTTHIPCRQAGPNAHLWTSEDPTDQKLAATLCTRCEALTACRTYITQHPNEAGTYGGITPTDRHGRPGRPPTNPSTKPNGARSRAASDLKGAHRG